MTKQKDQKSGLLPEVQAWFDVVEKARELYKYAELEGAEWGGHCMVLADFVVNLDTNIIGEDFKDMLKREVDHELDFVKSNARIIVRIIVVKETKVITKVITYEELIWKDEEE